MVFFRSAGLCLVASLIGLAAHAQTAPAPAEPAPSSAISIDDSFHRDPGQPVDEAYTAAIRRYTTEPQFLSPLVH